MATRTSTFPLAAVMLLAGLAAAAAHGGKFHEWPSTPTGSNYIRSRVASCNTWKPVSGPVKYSLVNATAAGSSAVAAAAAPLDVKGSVDVWHYLYKNCSLAEGAPPSAGAEFNVTLSRGGAPVEGLTADGVVMTEGCAAGGGSPFYFNASAKPLDGNENLLWFTNGTSGPGGRLAGNGANDGVVRTGGRDGVRSVVLVDAATRESLACCDLTLAGPEATDWAAKLQGKGVACKPDDDHAGHAAAQHDHSSMGHGDKAASDHAANASAAAPAAVKSAAGAAAASAAAAVLAAALPALLAVVA